MNSVIHGSVRKRSAPFGYGEFVSYWLRKNLLRPAMAGLDSVAEARPQRLKRVVDIGVSLLVLAVAGPAILVLLALVWLEGGGPIYGHVRVGRDGKPFCCWKIRTMVPAADGLLDALLSAQPALAAEWQRGHKLRHDPRVTWLGRWLRLTSFDELPQLWNVLRGEMSLVGPRPERPEFVTELTREIPYYGQRHVIRPGLTGWAQVRYTYGATREDALQKLQYDLYYIKNLSLALDFYIIFATIKTVILRRGA